MWVPDCRITSGMATETVNVRLPDGFDPKKHIRALEKRIADHYGEGFEIRTINVKLREAVAVRQSQITEVSDDTGETLEVSLPRGLKPSDGDKTATHLEDQHPGYVMTRFEPYLGQAVLTKSDPELRRCRGAVAVALGVKPWDVQVTRRGDGGYNLELPSSYVPSKHDTKLEEVATAVVGRDGWYVKIDPQKLTASLIPSDPPTFEETIMFPVNRLGRGDVDRTPFGQELPAPGKKVGEEVALDWTASAWALVAGTPGSGKLQPLTSRVPVPRSDRFPTGWATIGELSVGDLVFSRDGTPVRVNYLSDIQTQPVYRVRLSDGQTVEAGPDHLWLASNLESRRATRFRNTLHVNEPDTSADVRDETRERLRQLGRNNMAVGASVTKIAELFDTNVDEVNEVVGQARLPVCDTRTVLSAVGDVETVNVYAVDEFAVAYLRHLEQQWAREDDLHVPLLQVVSTEEIADRLHVDGSHQQPNWAFPVAAPVRLPNDDGLPDDLFHIGYKAVTNDTFVNQRLSARYLRAGTHQRLTLLQGLMSAGGHVASNGECVLTLPDPTLTVDALELVRSLGIKAHETGTHQIVFYTDMDMFRDKTDDLLPKWVSGDNLWLFVTDVEVHDPAPMRCIRVEHPEHTYLTDGFVPTHNTVTLNAIIADSLSNGSELVVVDDVSKAVDFEWCKPFCRPGGWGCDSLEAGVAALGLVREEGKKRAKKLKEMGLSNWLDMPAGERFTPILVIVDEVTALVVPDPVPKGVPKDHPLFLEIAERNLARAMLQSFMRKIIAELRFVGVRMVLSTQATNANTGVDPGLRTLIGHKILQGVNPSTAARAQIFADESAVPRVPENVKSGGKRARGVGVSTLEGAAPAIYKTYFNPAPDYAAKLRDLGVKVTHAPEPTASQIDKFLPSLDAGKEAPPAASTRGELAPSGRPASEVRPPGDDWDVDPVTGKRLTGYAKANAARHAAANAGKPTAKQRKESKEEAAWAARSGEVTVRNINDDPVDS